MHDPRRSRNAKTQGDERVDRHGLLDVARAGRAPRRGRRFDQLLDADKADDDARQRLSEAMAESCERMAMLIDLVAEQMRSRWAT
jgi:hypothetical protein